MRNWPSSSRRDNRKENHRYVLPVIRGRRRVPSARREDLPLQMNPSLRRFDASFFAICDEAHVSLPHFTVRVRRADAAVSQPADGVDQFRGLAHFKIESYVDQKRAESVQ